MQELIKKVFIRVAVNIVPVFIFSILTDLLLYHFGVVFFDKTFDMPYYLAFVAVFTPIIFFPINIIFLIIVSFYLKGRMSLKIAFVEYVFYIFLHIIIYLIFS